MATIINNPGPTESGAETGLGIILGIIVAIILIIVFFVYGLPALRNSAVPARERDTNINVTIPAPDIQVPGSGTTPGSGSAPANPY